MDGDGDGEAARSSRVDAAVRVENARNGSPPAVVFKSAVSVGSAAERNAEEEDGRNEEDEGRKEDKTEA